MTEVHSGHTGNAVDVFLAVYVPDTVALATLDDLRVIPLGEQNVTRMFIRQKIGQTCFIAGRNIVGILNTVEQYFIRLLFHNYTSVY